MLPDSNYFPTIRSQSTEVALVAGAIGAEFVAPESGELVFPSGQPPTVPKIAVHENGDTFSRKDDVRTAGQIANVTAEAKSFCSKFSLHQLFQRAVLQFHALHCAHALLGSQVVRHRAKSNSELLARREECFDSRFDILPHGRQFLLRLAGQ